MSLPIKPTLATLVFAGLLAGFAGAAVAEQPRNPAQRKSPALVPAASSVLGEDAKKGYALFNHNCAPCHGDDARGDEGPSLYNLAKSDTRITTILKGGIKGEMPAFAKKFADADIRAIIAFLRTLKE